MSTKNPPDRCTICNGTGPEHGPETRHAFTTREGDLRASPRYAPPQPKRGDTVTNRLVNVLLNKGVINEQEALSCYGVSSPGSPEASEQGSQGGFADPASMLPR